MNQKSGVNIIKNYLPNLSHGPGVYRMLDSGGNILYVGKAKNIRKRVANYAKLQGHSSRISRMIFSTSSMVFLSTETETEALLLEQNLIKQLKPRYNVLLRDDKSFPGILVTSNHKFAQISKHRGVRKIKGTYFGPFASVRAVNHTLNYLQRIFLLRNCSDSIFEGRSRPCLQYQIKRCSAPCVGKISKEDYSTLVSEAVQFLAGKTTKIQKSLAIKMAAASNAMNFETAAIYRDRIRALTQIQSHQGINPSNIEEADVVALALDGGVACVQVFFIRSFQNWGNKSFFPKTGSGADEAEILEAFLIQFYGNKVPSRLIIISHELENPKLLIQAFKIRQSRTTKIIQPKFGEKKTLLDYAMKNSKEELARKMAESESNQKLLVRLERFFELSELPSRIEIYDNSHIQGTHAVGAMVVWEPEGFRKSKYRKFNIPESIKPGDDVAMMAHVLRRRFTRLKLEDSEKNKGEWPSLILIDGGKAQTNAVEKVLLELGVREVLIVGVAKGVDRNAGRETFYQIKKAPTSLPSQDPLLYFIQRLRDEAHRFVIGAHRQKRIRTIGITRLDEIPGVGANRKHKLLSRFGSSKEVSGAGISDLRSVDGISLNLAKKIYSFFHNND